MKKYFCDRCGVEIIVEGGAMIQMASAAKSRKTMEALHELLDAGQTNYVSVRSASVLMMDLCSSCAEQLRDFLGKANK